jgi:zinc protease
MKQLSIYLIFISLLSNSLLTNAQINLTDKIPIPKEVKIGKLSNGLTYYIQKNNVPEKKAEMRLVVNVGSVLEDDNQSGVAHFVEHMNFNGSKQFPNNELVNYLQTIGVSFGADLNAYTNFDETVYILPIPTEKPEIIEKGFQVLEDWAGGASLTNEAIEKEKGVIMAELRNGKNAVKRMQNQYLPSLLNGSKYAQRLPIGKEEIIKNINPNLIRNFYRDWYRPNLMSVIIVGDIDPIEIEAKIKKHFSSLKNPINEKVRPLLIPVASRQKEEVFSVSDKEGEQTQIQIYNFIKATNPIINWEDYKNDITKNIFSLMFSARLQELTRQNNAPYLGAAAGFQEFGIRGYETFASSLIAGDGDVKIPINAFYTEIQRIKKFGFNDEELDRAKQGYLTYIENSVKEKDKTASKDFTEEYVQHFLTNNAIPSISDEVIFAKLILPKITISDINVLYLDLDGGQKKYILLTGPEKRNVAIPSTDSLLSYINEIKSLDIKDYTEKRVVTSLLDKIPDGGVLVSETKDDLLGITKLILKNGVSVTFKNTNFKNDEIELYASRPGGSNLYGIKDKYNSKFAASAVLQMGISELSLVELSKFLVGKNIKLTPYINETFEGYQGTSSVKDFETMLQLVYLYATKPRQDETGFNTFVNINKTTTAQRFQNPSIQFIDTLFKVLYNNNPPNRITSFLSPNEFDNLDINSISNIFNEKFGNADEMNFYLAGNLNNDSIKSLIISYLGALPAKKEIHEIKDKGVRTVSGNINFTFNKGKEQKSEAVIFFSGQTKYELKQEYILTVLNEILKIKLTEKLREEMSATYNPMVQGSFYKYPNEYYLSSIDILCAPESIDKIVTATLDIIKEFQNTGASPSYLAKVKESLRLKHDQEVKTNLYWVNTLNKFNNYHIDSKQVLNYQEIINSITMDDLKNAAKIYYDFNNHIVAKLMPE